MKERIKSIVSLFGKYAIAGLAFSLGAGIAIYAVWAFKGPTTGPGSGSTESTDKGSFVTDTRTIYYITTNTYDGSTASSACDAGYHMCLWNKDLINTNMVWDPAKSTTLTNSTITEYYAYWVDGDSSATAAGSNPDCNNWASNSGSHFGLVRFIGGGSEAFAGGAIYCNTSHRVLCCKN